MDWNRLADAVRRRRLALDRGQVEVAQRAKLTPVTISRIENGQPAKPRTLWKLDRGLDWKPGSAEAVATTGAEPVELPPEGEAYTDPDEAAIWAIDTLSEQRRREWIAEIRRLRAAGGGGDQERLAE